MKKIFKSITNILIGTLIMFLISMAVIGLCIMLGHFVSIINGLCGSSAIGAIVYSLIISFIISIILFFGFKQTNIEYNEKDNEDKEDYGMTDEEMINHLYTIQEQYPEESTLYQALDIAIDKLGG